MAKKKVLALEEDSGEIISPIESKISTFPGTVYHKDYDSKSPNGEEQLKKYSKVVNSQEELDNLGSDWGDLPGLVS